MLGLTSSEQWLEQRILEDAAVERVLKAMERFFTTREIRRGTASFNRTGHFVRPTTGNPEVEPSLRPDVLSHPGLPRPESTGRSRRMLKSAVLPELTDRSHTHSRESTNAVSSKCDDIRRLQTGNRITSLSRRPDCSGNPTRHGTQA